MAVVVARFGVIARSCSDLSDRSVETPAHFHRRMGPVDSAVMSEITRLIDAASVGDGRAAAQLLPLVYDELRKLAASEEWPPRHLATLSTPRPWSTRLTFDSIGDQHFEGRGHFFGAAAEAMRRILVNHARDRNRLKRVGGRSPRRTARSGWFPRPKIPTSCLSLDELLGPVSVRTTRSQLGWLNSTCSRGLTVENDGRGAGALASRRLPQLEVCPGMAPRGSEKIIRKSARRFFTRMGH